MPSLWSLASYYHSASLSVVPNTKDERAAIVGEPLAQNAFAKPIGILIWITFP